MSSATTLSRLTLGVAATTATTASGAIVVFDVNPDKTILPFAALGPNQASGIHIGNINLATGAFVQTSSSNYSEFYYGNSIATFSFGTLSYYGNSSFASGNNGGLIRADSLLLGGDSVDSPSAMWVNSTSAGIEFPSGTYYVGLRLTNGFDFNYGWLEMADDPVAGKLVTRFAFNDVVGGSILAGQTTAVPEASTLGLVGGLFGLVAAAHLRRRRQQQAAASDKFLALAAGEKLN